jgi:hypothetical protein
MKFFPFTQIFLQSLLDFSISRLFYYLLNLLLIPRIINIIHECLAIIPLVVLDVGIISFVYHLQGLMASCTNLNTSLTGIITFFNRLPEQSRLANNFFTSRKFKLFIGVLPLVLDQIHIFSVYFIRFNDHLILNRFFPYEVW